MQGLLRLGYVLRFLPAQLRRCQKGEAQAQHGEGCLCVQLAQGGKNGHRHTHGESHPTQDQGNEARGFGGRGLPGGGLCRAALHQFVNGNAQGLGQFGQGGGVRKRETGIT